MDDIQTRPYSIFEIINKGIKIFSENIGPIFTILVIINGLMLLVSIVVFVIGLTLLSGIVSIEWILIFIEFFAIIISSIGLMGIISLCEKAILHQEISWKDALKLGVSRWIGAFWTFLVGGVIILLLSLIFVVPGIVGYVYYAFTLFVVMLRNKTGKAALDYSKDLVKGQWWRVFSYLFVIGVLFAVSFYAIMMVLQLGDGSVMKSLGGEFSFLICALNYVILLVFFLNVDYQKHPSTPLNVAQPEVIESL